MQTQELTNKLQNIGFKDNESHVFLVLLKGSAMSASEIAEKASIRRTAVYEILKSFASRGFCNEIETNTILKYEMIDPEIIGDKIESELKKQSESRIENLKETFGDFKNLYRSEESEENKKVNIELIRGFNKHRQEKFIELLNSAKNEILFMIRLEGYISEELDTSASEFYKKGGVIKSIYETSLNFKIIKDNARKNATTEDLLRICRKFEKSGEQVRISEKQLPNMTIFDRKIVFFNIHDKSIPRHSNSDIIIRNEDFASRMIDLFKFYWDISSDVDSFKIVSKEEKSTNKKVSSKNSKVI